MQVGRGLEFQASMHQHPVASGKKEAGPWRCPCTALIGLALAPCLFSQSVLSLSGFQANGNEEVGPGGSAFPRKGSWLAARWELLKREGKEHAWREMEGSQPEPPGEGNEESSYKPR